MRLFLLLLACAGPNQARRADAVLLVECDVPAASVYVDEHFAGRAAEMGARGLSVPHGNLRVEVRADGYYPAYRDVPVKAGERAHVQVGLRAVPEGEP
jgi:PEGA domain